MTPWAARNRRALSIFEEARREAFPIFNSEWPPENGEESHAAGHARLREEFHCGAEGISSLGRFLRMKAKSPQSDKMSAFLATSLILRHLRLPAFLL